MATPKRRHTDDTPPPLARLVLIVLVCGALIACAIFGSGIWIASQTGENCQRIHKVVRTLDTILASGEAQTRQYVREGLLTPEQAERASRYREQQRDVLRGADCPPPQL